MQYARDYKPHPDPAVSAIALRYARWYLDARTRRGRRQYLAIGLAIAVIVAAAVVLGWFSGGPAAGRPSAGEKDLVWLAATLVAAAILITSAARKTRLMRVYRLELANKPMVDAAVWASAGDAARSTTRPSTTGATPATGQELNVRYDRRRVMRRSARLLLIVFFTSAAIAGEGLSDSFAAPIFFVVCGFLVGLMALMIVPQVMMLVRWVLPGRPLLVLDSGGVHLPSISCDLPWDLLTEVRLTPMRYGRRGDQEALVVAFVPQDPSAVLAAIPGGGRRRDRLERSVRVYGTPLSVRDKVIDHSGEQIAAAATSFAAVPVRRS